MIQLDEVEEVSSFTVVVPGGAAGCGVADLEKMCGTGLSWAK